MGSRCPWRKDPDLDYDIDSDEEWEEVLYVSLLFRLKFRCKPGNNILISQEEPGESLSDCDKDEEEESCEGCSKVDEDETEDGFFVPDGYLSENEVKTDLEDILSCY